MMNNLNNNELRIVLSHLNGAELAHMKTVSTRYRNYINRNATLSDRIRRERNRRMTMQHIVRMIGELNGTMFQLNQNQQRRIIDHIMAFPQNRHPLTFVGTRQAFFDFFH
jgi:hypothetical protein